MSKPHRKPSVQQVRFDAVMHCRDLTLAEAYVLLALLSYTYGERKVCWPSISSLAKRARMSQRSLQRRLADLKNKGLLDYRPKSDHHRPDRAPYEFSVKWSKLKATRCHTDTPQQPDEATNGVSACHERGVSLSRTGCHAVARNNKKETTKENGETVPPKAGLSLSGSGLAAGPEEACSSSEAGRERDRPAGGCVSTSKTGKPEWASFLPAKRTRRFCQFLELWHKVLPKSIKLQDDLDALKRWSKAWDALPAFHRDGIPFYILEAIARDPYWSGKKTDKEGSRFIMRPDFLVDSDPQSKKPRWRLIQEGNFRSLGESYLRVVEDTASLIAGSCNSFILSNPAGVELSNDLLIRALTHAGREFEEATGNYYLLDAFRRELTARIARQQTRRTKSKEEIDAELLATAERMEAEAREREAQQRIQATTTDPAAYSEPERSGYRRSEQE